MNKYNLKIPFFALAPMANITTYPFASQAVKFGADLVWTPMVHTDTIINNWPEAEKILDFKEINNYIVQIVGSEPEKFVAAVELIEKSLKPRGIDLNFACPDKNIVKSGCGGALLQDEDKLLEIVKEVKKATELPVSVKTRLGWDDPGQIYALAPKLEALGVAMLTVHGRVVRQAFGGTADWGAIKRIKQNSRMLIIGSGDIRSWEDAIGMQKETQVDGIMIGRGALGKPWLFTEIKEKKDYTPTPDEIKKLTLDLAKKANDIWGGKGIIESKKHFGWYFRGFPGALEYRKKLMDSHSIADVQNILANK